MTSKKLFYTGIIFISLSILASMIVPLWGFLRAFNNLRMNETSGIGAVGGLIENTIIVFIFAVFGIFIGIILSIFGWLKMKRESEILDNIS